MFLPRSIPQNVTDFKEITGSPRTGGDAPPAAGEPAFPGPGLRSRPMPPKLITFDWGGVLLRICRSFEEGCRAAGLPHHPDVLDEDLYQVRRKHSLAYQVGRMTADEFFQHSAEATGGRYGPEEIARVHDAWLLGEYPGAVELIDELNALPGVETGMLSNTNERHWLRQAESEHGPFFPAAARITHRHASHLLGFAKPDERIYRAYERATGYASGQILFFDDLAENVEAARRCGWHAEVIDHTGDTVSQMREHLRRHGVL